VNTLFSLLARLAMGRCYVFMPMASRFHIKKVVKCPESINLPRFWLTGSGSTSSPRKAVFHQKL
jgi:hypothetical protein